MTHTLPPAAFNAACETVFRLGSSGPDMAAALGIAPRTFYLYRSGQREAPVEIGGRLLILAAAARARLDAVEERLERLTTGPEMARDSEDDAV